MNIKPTFLGCGLLKGEYYRENMSGSIFNRSFVSNHLKILYCPLVETTAIHKHLMNRVSSVWQTQRDCLAALSRHDSDRLPVLRRNKGETDSLEKGNERKHNFLAAPNSEQKHEDVNKMQP